MGKLFAYLARLRLDVQLLDTFPRNESVRGSCDGGTGHRVGTVLQTFKQTVLLLVTSRGAERDGLDFSRRTHVEFVLQCRARLGCHWSTGILLVLLFGGILYNIGHHVITLKFSDF